MQLEALSWPLVFDAACGFAAWCSAYGKGNWAVDLEALFTEKVA